LILFPLFCLPHRRHTRKHYDHAPPPVIPTAALPETIFVSLASYRDRSCPLTVESLFSNAAYPENLVVGLCQQNSPADVDCAINDQIKPEWKQSIRAIRLNHYEAQGPTWARYLCSTLFQDETYYMQIDSHCLFAKNWDVKLIAMIKQLKAAGVQKPLLSHYTKEHDVIGTPMDYTCKVPGICKSFLTERRLISFQGAEYIHYKPGDLPMPNAFVAGGMIFGESQFTREVPYDPNLPYLHVGEEILHSIRLWTHGWDIFTPSENAVYHSYTRKGEPRIWTDVTYSDEDAVNKVRNLLDLEGAVEISPYLKSMGLAPNARSRNT
jgi:hypothetical protein